MWNSKNLNRITFAIYWTLVAGVTSQCTPGSVDVQLAFTSESSKGYVQDMIAQSKTVILAAVYKFTDQDYMNEMIEAMSGRGVEIKLIVDYTESLKVKQNDVLSKLLSSGAEVRAYYEPLRPDKITKLHAKIAIFDNKTVVTGSMNWAGKMGENVELLIPFRSGCLTSKFISTFEFLWAKGVDLPPPKAKAKSFHFGWAALLLTTGAVATLSACGVYTWMRCSKTACEAGERTRLLARF
eukprot:176671_1